MDIGAIWELIILNPMINVLIVVSKFLFNSPGLAIILFTIIMRLITYPLTKKQMQSAKKMQEIQPKIQELKKKYGKDKERLAKEQAPLLKAAGATGSGCLVPMLIQMPIWLALYQSITRVLATSPESLLNLSRHLYPSWGLVFQMVPMNSQFLWLDIGVPDTLYIMPILVGITMWMQQKMTTPQTTDLQQKATSNTMMVTMPLLFAFMTLSFPSGLALYWVASGIIGIVMQYYIGGWGGLAGVFGKKKPDDTIKPSKPSSEPRKISPKEIDSTARHIVTGSKNVEKEKPKWIFWK